MANNVCRGIVELTGEPCKCKIAPNCDGYCVRHYTRTAKFIDVLEKGYCINRLHNSCSGMALPGQQQCETCCEKENVPEKKRYQATKLLNDSKIEKGEDTTIINCLKCWKEFQYGSVITKNHNKSQFCTKCFEAKRIIKK